MFGISAIENKIIAKGRNELGIFKMVYSVEEEELIKDLNDTLLIIENKNKSKPLIYTFCSNYYVSNIVMRMLKFKISGRITPSKKFALIDLRAQLGNYNDLFSCFDYLGIMKKDEQMFDSRKIYNSVTVNDKGYIKEFLNYSKDKIVGLAKLTSEYKGVTYDNEFRQPVIVDIETHANFSMKEEFLEEYPRYREEGESEIYKLMARNPLYNVLYSYSLCYLAE
ncbi:hypothetical protein [uncultured Cetobacterium sp.]|uniref:hypothetical protein n=1 Tax=uncultured Cetobacterium sp. TaxID=527638 RepID=UPI00261D43F4|nr:hypothetical protein [uncultured Cetobacterium sp.]